MMQPEEFIDEKHPNKVLKLTNVSHGLKQSRRQWNFELGDIL